MSIRQGNSIISGSSIAQALINQKDNSTLIKTWTGTKAEYEAITIKDSNTLYNITDDNTHAMVANPDLSNLTNIGKNIANWSSNVSNCITEIPQDIKLELNGGTLTLKAGSKVYVPNGAGVFDEVIIASDLTATYPDTSDVKCFLFYVNGTLNLGNISVSVSGTTPPTTGFFYNTSTNKISFYLDGNMVWDNGSFPLCIASCSNSSVNSIDQVFNGFGYIGSTVFALPSVKGLIPNGRNADGSLKNTAVVLNTVLTYTEPTSATTPIYIRINNDSILFGSSAPSARYYDEQTNYNYWDGSINSMAWIGKGQLTSGKITSFTPKTAFHALDYNELKSLPNYNPTKTQTLKHVKGVLQWG